MERLVRSDRGPTSLYGGDQLPLGEGVCGPRPVPDAPRGLGWGGRQPPPQAVDLRPPPGSGALIRGGQLAWEPGVKNGGNPLPESLSGEYKVFSGNLRPRDKQTSAGDPPWGGEDPTNFSAPPPIDRKFDPAACPDGGDVALRDVLPLELAPEHRRASCPWARPLERSFDCFRCRNGG